MKTLHRGAFCQFPFWLIYYCHSSKSTGKESGKMRLCAVVQSRQQALRAYCSSIYTMIRPLFKLHFCNILIKQK